MRVILLSGPDHCGKTTSLNVLFNRIKEAYGVEVLRKDTVDKWEKDFVYKVRYPDGKKLVIATQGDYKHLLIEDYCKKIQDCDILVCACNQKFMRCRKDNPFDRVTDYDPLTTIVLKKKYKPAEAEKKDVFKKANEVCAEHLLELIEIIRKQIK